MKHLLLLLALGLSSAANASEDLARKSACFACHAVNKKLLGPSFQQVASKYRGQADATALLKERIKNGGSGVWGPTPMPAQVNLKDEDAIALATWILKLPPP